MLARAFADFIQQFLGAAIDIFALQQVFIGPDMGGIVATQRIAGAVGIGRVGAPCIVWRLAIALLLVFGQCIAKVADAFAHLVDSLGLSVHRIGQIAFAQGFFGLIHGATSLIKALPAAFAQFTAGAGKFAILAQLIQLVAKLGLTV